MTDPSNEVSNSLMEASAPRMVDVPWEDVFTPEELATMPLMDGPTMAYPGTDVVCTARPQKFRLLDDVRKLLLSGKNHSGEYDVCVMRWQFKEAFPSKGSTALGADPDVSFGYFVWYAMLSRTRIQELTMQVGLS